MLFVQRVELFHGDSKCRVRCIAGISDYFYVVDLIVNPRQGGGMKGKEKEKEKEGSLYPTP